MVLWTCSGLERNGCDAGVSPPRETTHTAPSSRAEEATKIGAGGSMGPGAAPASGAGGGAHASDQCENPAGPNGYVSSLPLLSPSGFEPASSLTTHDALTAPVSGSSRRSTVDPPSNDTNATPCALEKCTLRPSRPRTHSGNISLFPTSTTASPLSFGPSG